MKIEDLSFEQAMAELDTIVLEMERGEIPLEASLKQFERGVTLARHTQKLLQDAEQKVKILTSAQGNNGTDTLTEFTE
ncbi:MAG: exodeoxyribonuclease VII small subunit [Kangiellaceae bacterium]|jgi:exodeoxyribonuclease VII small subunit